MYWTVLSSPFVPGARPSNASDDSTFVCVRILSTFTAGSWPIGVVPAEVSPAYFTFTPEPPHDTPPMPPEPEHDVKVKYRSEEHTSELQSHSDLVCRLLLEKKKKKNKKNNN